MATKIGRRDFLNGVAIGGSGLFLQGFGTDVKALAAAPNGSSPAPNSLSPSTYYPPTLTGMRGSHEGSFEGRPCTGLARRKTRAIPASR